MVYHVHPLYHWNNQHPWIASKFCSSCSGPLLLINGVQNPLFLALYQVITVFFHPSKWNYWTLPTYNRIRGPYGKSLEELVATNLGVSGALHFFCCLLHMHWWLQSMSRHQDWWCFLRSAVDSQWYWTLKKSHRIHVWHIYLHLP